MKLEPAMPVLCGLWTPTHSMLAMAASTLDPPRANMSL